MAVRSFTNPVRFSYGTNAQYAQYNAVDFFAIGSGGSVAAAGFLALGEGIVAAMFIAVAIAFYGASLTCFIQYRRFRRLAIKHRLVAVSVGEGRDQRVRG